MVLITVDDFQESKKMESTARKLWLLRHRNYLKEWIYNHFSHDSYHSLYAQALEDERLQPMFYSIVQNDMMTNKEKIERILNSLKARGQIVLIIGGRGSGKTVLAYDLAEKQYNLTKEDIWYFGLPTDFPRFITGSTIDFDRLPENTTSILEEAGVQFYNRLAMTRHQRDIMRKLPIVRHSKRNFFVITQAIEITDINFLTNASSVIYTSPVFFQFLEKGRETIQSRLMMFVPKKLGKALFYNDDLGLIEFDYNLPTWWKESFSTPYAPIKDMKKAYKIIVELLYLGADPDMISTQLVLRNIRIPEIEIARMSEIVKRISINLLALPDEEIMRIVSAGFDDTPIGETPANKHYHFEQTPVQKMIWDYRLKGDPDLYITTGTCINKEIYQQIKFSVLKRHTILSIFGETGSGKTWAAASLAMLIAKITKHPFDIKNVKYDGNSIMERLKEVKRNATLIRNEQLKKWGSGSGREEQELKNAEQTMRRMHVNFIFVSPDLRDHNHHFILETHSLDETKGICKMMVMSPERKYLGYITIRKPSHDIIEKLEPLDESAKRKVVERTSSEKTNVHDAVEILSKDQTYAILRSQSQRIAYIEDKCPNMTKDEQLGILSRLEIKQLVSNKK